MLRSRLADVARARRALFRSRFRPIANPFRRHAPQSWDGAPKVELPEVDAKDVEIQIEGNALTLRGDRRLEKADQRELYHRIERSYGPFSRTFTVPSTVDTENTTAECRNGVLRVRLPKRAEIKPKQIKVQVEGMTGLGEKTKH